MGKNMVEREDTMQEGDGTRSNTGDKKTEKGNEEDKDADDRAEARKQSS